MPKRLIKKGQKKAEKKQQESENEGDWESDFEDNDHQQQEEEKDNKIDNTTLYKLLNVEKNATHQEISKSYRKLALELHPDKNPSEEAKEKFQKVKDAYNILKDDEKRKIYDETGSYGDDFNNEEFDAAYAYFRTLYKKIEQADIEEFEKNYKHSKEEEQDLLDFYNENQGDMTLILETIILSTNEDADRFIEFYEKQIKDGKLKKYGKFDKTKKKIKYLEDESEEAQGALSELAQQIMVRGQERFDNLFSMLESKYAQPKKQKKTQKKGTESNKGSKKLKKK